MDNKFKINPSIVVGVILALAVVGGIVWYWQSKKATPPQTKPTGLSQGQPAPSNLPQGVVTGGLGSNIFEKSQNPIVDKLPETNPFGGQVNPFEKGTNPLKTLYKNPFK